MKRLLLALSMVSVAFCATSSHAKSNKKKGRATVSQKRSHKSYAYTFREFQKLSRYQKLQYLKKVRTLLVKMEKRQRNFMSIGMQKNEQNLPFFSLLWPSAFAQDATEDEKPPSYLDLLDEAGLLNEQERDLAGTGDGTKAGRMKPPASAQTRDVPARMKNDLPVSTSTNTPVETTTSDNSSTSTTTSSTSTESTNSYCNTEAGEKCCIHSGNIIRQTSEFKCYGEDQIGCQTSSGAAGFYCNPLLFGFDPATDPMQPYCIEKKSPHDYTNWCLQKLDEIGEDGENQILATITANEELWASMVGAIDSYCNSSEVQEHNIGNCEVLRLRIENLEQKLAPAPEVSVEGQSAQ